MADTLRASDVGGGPVNVTVVKWSQGRRLVTVDDDTTIAFTRRAAEDLELIVSDGDAGTPVGASSIPQPDGRPYARWREADWLRSRSLVCHRPDDHNVFVATGLGRAVVEAFDRYREQHDEEI